ncbi:hypothetical protein, partial [Escherichia coli]|uniref:hypothetical protein n=1 Tax=Escherichia coli TaxID=562 RepID=UPI003EE10881
LHPAPRKGLPGFYGAFFAVRNIVQVGGTGGNCGNRLEPRGFQWFPPVPTVAFCGNRGGYFLFSAVPTSSRRVPTQKRTIIILVILLFTDLYMFYFYGSHSSHQSHHFFSF